MAVFVGLLRGINVGGKHKLPMATLTSMFEAAGARNVETYIQSGNVVFEAAARARASIAAAVAEHVEQALGFSAPVVVRDAAALARVVAENPFVEVTDPKLVHVMFFDRKPSRSAVAAFEPPITRGEVVELRADLLYLHHPQGSARSKISVALVDRQLGIRSTARNWRTTLELHARTQKRG